MLSRAATITRSMRSARTIVSSSSGRVDPGRRLAGGDGAVDVVRGAHGVGLADRDERGAVGVGPGDRVDVHLRRGGPLRRGRTGGGSSHSFRKRFLSVPRMGWESARRTVGPAPRRCAGARHRAGSGATSPDRCASVGRPARCCRARRLGRSIPARRLRALEHRPHRRPRARAELGRGHGRGRERRRGVGGERDVVEADDRQVGRDAASARLHGAQQPHRHQIVVGEHGGRAGGEHRGRGSRAAVEVDAAGEFVDDDVGVVLAEVARSPRGAPRSRRCARCRRDRPALRWPSSCRCSRASPSAPR